MAFQYEIFNVLLGDFYLPKVQMTDKSDIIIIGVNRY